MIYSKQAKLSNQKVEAAHGCYNVCESNLLSHFVGEPLEWSLELVESFPVQSGTDELSNSLGENT
jgi:hypothetical protein